MGLGSWVSFEFSDEDSLDHAIPSMPEKPDYPYGMRGCFTGRELELMKLPLPKVGDMLDMRAMLVVTSISDSGDGGQRVEGTMMAAKLENEDTEDTSSGDDDDE